MIGVASDRCVGSPTAREAVMQLSHSLRVALPRHAESLLIDSGGRTARRMLTAFSLLKSRESPASFHTKCAILPLRLPDEYVSPWRGSYQLD
jgi:hypothetical protein